MKHGVMKDEASSIFNGIGKIEHGASKSNAEQESRVLMLSEKARGDANPILLLMKMMLLQDMPLQSAALIRFSFTI